MTQENLIEPEARILRAWLEEYWPAQSILIPHGMERAFVGMAERAGQKPVPCFDTDFCKTLIAEECGITLAEAHDFFMRHLASVDMGERTPCFVTLKRASNRN